MAETAQASWIFSAISGHGDKPFIFERDKCYSYAQLLERIESANAQLRDWGIAPGTVVALQSDYSFEAVALLLALYRNRNIIAPISTEAAGEVRTRVEEGRVEWLLKPTDKDTSCEQVEGKPEENALIGRLRGENRAGLILFSSGSTGKPKAMIHDLDSLLDSYRGKPLNNLTLLAFLLFDHIGGLNTLFNVLAMGAALVITESRRTDSVCALIERRQVNVLPTSPTFLNLILMSEAHFRHDLSCLKIITYGTEPMAGSLLERLEKAFPEVKLLQTFGTSETGIAHTRSLSNSSTLLKIDDPNVECRIVDDELLLRSKTQILGYLNYPMDAFTEDGWFRTGDLVEQAQDGYLRIVGRKVEMINVAGQKVLPTEVESALMEMPEVADCLVHGAPNAITGQTVEARIVTKERGDSASIRKAVRRFCRGRLEPYKIPTRIRMVEEIPSGERFKKIRRTS